MPGNGHTKKGRDVDVRNANEMRTVEEAKTNKRRTNPLAKLADTRHRGAEVRAMMREKCTGFVMGLGRYVVVTMW